MCGDVTMASDVQKAMLGMIKESLKCSEQECKNLIYDIKVSFTLRKLKRFFINQVVFSHTPE